MLTAACFFIASHIVANLKGQLAVRPKDSITKSRSEYRRESWWGHGDMIVDWTETAGVADFLIIAGTQNLLVRSFSEVIPKMHE